MRQGCSCSEYVEQLRRQKLSSDHLKHCSTSHWWQTSRNFSSEMQTHPLNSKSTLEVMRRTPVCKHQAPIYRRVEFRETEMRRTFLSCAEGPFSGNRSRSDGRKNQNRERKPKLYSHVRESCLNSRPSQSCHPLLDHNHRHNCNWMNIAVFMLSARWFPRPPSARRTTRPGGWKTNAHVLLSQGVAKSFRWYSLAVGWGWRIYT